jgi:RimJ/RimL family protein N-acetyltransferase
LAEDHLVGEGCGEVPIEYADYFWQGEKVRLRPLKPEDWEDHYRGAFDSPARQVLQLGMDLPLSPQAAKDFIGKYEDCKDVGGILLFTIESLDGEAVGGISLHSRSQKNGTFGFGVVIYRAHRRRGYAEEAVRILFRYCFQERRFQKCNSACVETNAESLALHKKLGFLKEGCRRRSLYFAGQYHDDILLGLTKEEFAENDAARAGVR